MHIRYKLLITICIACGYSSSFIIDVAAQDVRTPKEFFEKDYVASTKTARTQAEKKDQANGQKSANTDINSQTEQEKNKQELNTKKASQDLNKNLRPGLDIRNISVILNCVDEAHCDKTLKHLYEVVVKHDLDIGDIYTIGSFPRLYTDEYQQYFTLYGSYFTPLSDIPDEYKHLELSPTWIIRVAQKDGTDGEFLLEGIDNISLFINNLGQFTEEPEILPVVKEVPAPPKVDQF